MDSSAASKRPHTAGNAVDSGDGAHQHGETSSTGTGSRDSPVVLESMLRSVSPPRKRQRQQQKQQQQQQKQQQQQQDAVGCSFDAPLRSPFQLTTIRDLPASANVDTLTVRDVFGSPALAECWEFNYLHDLDFLVDAFDEEAVSRGLAVHVVHGFWKSEDPRRGALEQEAQRINRRWTSNGGSITLHTAYLPEPFATHHTKMAVLFRDDDTTTTTTTTTAQIVIHTANMIPHDWENMTQAVWRSPLLPLAPGGEDGAVGEATELCVGDSFKKDFLNYLRAYNQRRPVCRALVEKLVRYDFSAVQAVLIGSVPGRHAVLHSSEMEALDETGATPTQWGWAAMTRALRQVPIQASPTAAAAASTAATGSKATPATAEIVAQVSSIATLGGNDAWLRQTLFNALAGGKAAPGARLQPQKAGYGPLRVPQPRPAKPQFRVVFPVADEIRRSLDGYVSGTSIHAKIQSPQQQRQLEYMRPMLCHWANDVADGEALPDSSEAPRRDAGRNRAAPHIKTYVRYAPDGSIDWALMTSANLSKQAWGESKSMMDEMRIASYELGVLVWPELLAAGATMQPVFGRDTLEESEPGSGPVVPLRMPYSLPLQRYGKTEIPWVATMAHAQPDWRGASWQVG